MILGIPAITFLALVLQIVIIVLSLIYAFNYEKLIKKAPFNFFAKLQDDVDKMKEGK